MSATIQTSQPGADIPTPALVVDLDVFESNVAEMAALLRGTGKTVRPHVKTHRTPELAKRQLGGSVVGLTCATVGEAEAMVAAGLDDLLIANEVVEPDKIERVVRLAGRASLTLAADDPEPVELLAYKAARAGVTVGVLVDVDVLLHRCGVASSEGALALASLVRRSRGVHLAGLMGYEGRLRASVPDRAAKIGRAYEVLAEVRDTLVDAGLPVACVSAAGTSTLREALVDPTITEIQAGVYALIEPELGDLGLPFRCAAVVRGTVISRDADRLVVDVGRRTVGVEYGPPVAVQVRASSVTVGDEHTIVGLDGPAPRLGATVDFIPGQIRTTFNLHDYVWIARRGRIVDRWPVSARGRSQ